MEIKGGTDLLVTCPVVSRKYNYTNYSVVCGTNIYSDICETKH